MRATGRAGTLRRFTSSQKSLIMLSLVCPQCGARLHVPDDTTASKARCREPNCRHVFPIAANIVSDTAAEICTNCTRIIGEEEVPHVYEQQVVCPECYRRLTDQGPLSGDLGDFEDMVYAFDMEGGETKVNGSAPEDVPTKADQWARCKQIAKTAAQKIAGLEPLAGIDSAKILEEAFYGEGDTQRQAENRVIDIVELFRETALATRVRQKEDELHRGTYAQLLCEHALNVVRHVCEGRRAHNVDKGSLSEEEIAEVLADEIDQLNERYLDHKAHSLRSEVDPASLSMYARLERHVIRLPFASDRASSESPTCSKCGVYLQAPDVTQPSRGRCPACRHVVPLVPSKKAEAVANQDAGASSDTKDLPLVGRRRAERKPKDETEQSVASDPRAPREEKKRCENCGRSIGMLETPYRYGGHTVCHECYERLKRQTPKPTPAEYPTDRASEQFQPKPQSRVHTDQPTKVTERQPADRQDITSSELSAYIQKNADYYLRKWPSLDATFRTVKPGTFNWAACILDVYWMAYRKMYLYTVGYLGVMFVLWTVIEWLYPAGPFHVMALLMKVFFGRYGSAVYKQHVEKTIRKIKATRRPELWRDNFIGLGGTNWWATIPLAIFHFLQIYGTYLAIV